MSDGRGSSDAASGDPLARILDDLRAFREGIEASADDDHAYREASRLVAAIAGERGLAANVRARIALRIWRRNDLSIGQLAKRLGISKQRADQFIRKGREQEP